MTHIHTFALVAGLLVGMAAPEAQQPSPPVPPAAPRAPQSPAAPRAPQPPTAPANQVAPFSDERGATDTRDRLRVVLEQYPPSVRQVLRIDTSLLSRPDYLATYPALAAFLEQHPEVAHNPAYFVGTPDFYVERNTDPQFEAIRAWGNFLEFIPVVAIVFIITTALAGLIRTLLEQRRWQRAWRAQTDIHTKLVDRFGSSEDLLAYLQSPAGKGLTEMPAVPATSLPPSMGAPLGRIFWSLQGGIVMGASGLGLLFVSRRIGVVGEPMFALGTVVLMIGIGFVVSAGISFFLSQRLGLVQPLSGRYSGQEPGS